MEEYDKTLILFVYERTIWLISNEDTHELDRRDFTCCDIEHFREWLYRLHARGYRSHSLYKLVRYCTYKTLNCIITWSLDKSLTFSIVSCRDWMHSKYSVEWIRIQGSDELSVSYFLFWEVSSENTFRDVRVKIRSQKSDLWRHSRHWHITSNCQKMYSVILKKYLVFFFTPLIRMHRLQFSLLISRDRPLSVLSIISFPVVITSRSNHFWYLCLVADHHLSYDSHFVMLYSDMLWFVVFAFLHLSSSRRK